MKEASRSLENVQDKSSESYKLSKGLYLHHEGDTYFRNRDYKRALESLESSLKFTEKLLKAHTDLARCYNSIGNCLYHLGKPMKALEFYNKAYKMQKELAGSEYHPDMPMYKNQIGTVYESLGEYDKAVEWYRGALSLLKELKLSGFHDEAHFQRNLANALMFQKKYVEAVEPADRAYGIRVSVLGNHPLTTQSIFQQAVLQANFGEYKKALKLFLEAWEMEKSLGAGNHSEVWQKIITGVEDMYDFSEKEFQQKFDQETDNILLNDLLQERDEISDKVIELYLQVSDHEKLKKYKNIKMALYKKVLVRSDFVAEKDYIYDKATLKSKVEQLYRDVGQKEKIPEFQENLLRTWQKQWEEGKDEKMKEAGVARERMINGILQLCKELQKKEMFRRYGEEVLSFYENKWEAKQSKMKPPEMKKFLRDIKQLATSIGDQEREKVYDEALQVGFNFLCCTRTGVHARNTFCSAEFTDDVKYILSYDSLSCQKEGIKSMIVKCNKYSSLCIVFRNSRALEFFQPF